MISVAMTSYNGEAFIQEQIESIFAQTQVPDELIIVDDGSTDQTVTVVKELQQRYTQIQLYENPENLGYKLNFKRAVSLCKGDFIFLCDQDDRWTPDKIAVLMKVFADHPELTVVASSFEFMDADSQPYQIELAPGWSNNNFYPHEVAPGALHKVTFEEFIAHNYFQGCALGLRREAADFFIANYSGILHHDWFLSLWAARNEAFAFLNVPLFYYRTHANNAIGVSAATHDRLWMAKADNENLLNVLSTLEEVDPDFYNSNPQYKKMQEFACNYSYWLENYKVMPLLLHFFDPSYCYLKPTPNRMNDLRILMEARKQKKNKPDRRQQP